MREPEPGPLGVGPVLRVSTPTSDGPGAEAMCGWTTPELEAARLQRDHGGDVVSGGAFGRQWPVVVIGGSSVVAPAVPVRVTSQAVDGPDASYDLADGAVWRTNAAGRDRLVAITSGDHPPGDPADLLWFEDTTRWLVRGGVLEVDDAFSRLTVPASPAELERLLVRARRVDPSVLDGLQSTPPGHGRARLEVWREAELVDPGDIDEPQRLLARRPEVERIVRRGHLLVGVDVDGEHIELGLIDIGGDGWLIERHEGRLPFDRLRLQRSGPRICLSADVAASMNPFAPGVRQRMAFDLFADLVAVGRERGQNR